MTSKLYFANSFEDFSSNSCEILNKSGDAVSKEFEQKLKNFQTRKLNILTTKMKKHIFYDDTIYTGSTGLALYYYMCTLGKNNTDTHGLYQKALAYLDINKLKGRRITFLCGDAGPLALATVLSCKLGGQRPDDIPDCKTIAQKLLSLASLSNGSPDEILYGRSGYLYALLFVKAHLPAENLIPSENIQKVVNDIIESGKKISTEKHSESPLLWHWHDKIYMGGAHGMAGIIYLLLQAREYMNENDLKELVKPTLDRVLNTQFPSGNFPSSLGSSSGDRLVQWCHGAPGFVPLCLLAQKVFGGNRYQKVAERCGDVVWRRGICTKGYSICHGVAGNAYTFIQLYQATKDPEQLYRACCFAEWCMEERPGTELHTPDRPASLFEGLLGRIYLAEELMHVGDAKFPAFTV